MIFLQEVSNAYYRINPLKRPRERLAGKCAKVVGRPLLECLALIIYFFIFAKGALNDLGNEIWKYSPPFYYIWPLEDTEKNGKQLGWQTM